MKKQKSKIPEKREIYYIVKDSVMEYRLMRLTVLNGKEVIDDTQVHKDIPAIVLGKLFQKVRQQEVG